MSEGMQTKISVIDGVDGHTPDMLRKRKDEEKIAEDNAVEPDRD